MEDKKTMKPKKKPFRNEPLMITIRELTGGTK